MPSTHSSTLTLLALACTAISAQNCGNTTVGALAYHNMIPDGHTAINTLCTVHTANCTQTATGGTRCVTHAEQIEAGYEVDFLGVEPFGLSTTADFTQCSTALGLIIDNCIASEGQQAGTWESPDGNILYAMTVQGSGVAT